MQQGMKLPEPKRKEDANVITLGTMTITANPTIAKVKGDLEDKSGVKISDYPRLLGGNMEIFNNPAAPVSLKRQILKDLITIVEADMAKMKQARNSDSEIKANEKNNPKYSKAMDTYLSDLADGVAGFKQALRLLDESTVAGAPKKV